MPIPRSGSIVTRQEIFEEKYLPDVLPMRQNQIQEITRYLAPVVRRQRPMHVWLYGPVGAGKTATARYILEKLMREHRVSGVYINCWEQNSLYFVLSKILDDLRILHTDVRDTAFKRERLRRHLRDEPLIVILDEIDKPMPQERNAILYNLATIDKVGLICICNSRYFFHLSEDRVRSRIAPAQIEFPSYSSAELKSILRSRVIQGLAERSCNFTLVDRIAELAGGDARVAIQTLKRAGLLAEQDGSSIIQAEQIRKAWAKALGRRKSYILRDLTEDHRIIYRIISEKKQVLSGQLFAEYRRRCQAMQRRPLAIRTFSNYLNALVNSRLITTERARVPGKVRLLKVAG